MAYDSNTQIISAPVSIYDVQQAIGNASPDLGTLCRAGTVNKWARYKPVPKNKLDTTDELKNVLTNKTWKTTASWWKGTSGNCGISFLTFGSVALTKAAIDAKTVVWSRVAPTGGSTQPYRQIDFNEYCHIALPPTYALSASNAQLKAGSVLKIMVATSVDDGYGVRFSHIGSFDNYYHTVAIYDTNGNLKLIHSASKTVGQYGDGESIEIDIPYNNGSYGYQGILLENHTYYAYAFISSAQYSCATTEFSGGSYTYIPMPCGEADYGMQPTSFLCKADLKWAVVDAYCAAGGRIVTWTVDMYGNGTPTATIRLIDLQGNIVSGETVSLNFSTGEETKGGTTITTTVTSVQAGDGTPGYEMSSGVYSSLLLPTNNPESYLVEFVCNGIDTVRAGIGHDINPNI